MSEHKPVVLQTMGASEFDEGFTLRTMLGVLFIAIVMAPGSIYLNLVAGSSLGGAAEWVTIILFVEIARRSMSTLKKQEIFLLYYVAAALMGSELASAGGPLWTQYFIQCDAARDTGIAQQLPSWVGPKLGSAALAARTLFHRDWLPALALMVLGVITSRISWFSMSYLLYRMTSDVEHLNFPMAPIAAGGSTALAESSAGKETWRWRVFSTGAVIGIVFGAIYVGLPTCTGSLTGTPVFLLPIPWLDFTKATEHLLPATALGCTLNLGTLLVGAVLPFWIVVGSFIGAMTSIVVNPLLYHYGWLTSWHPGMDTIQIMFVNGIDFWMSFGMGIAFAVALIGLISTARALTAAGWGAKTRTTTQLPPGRGDFPIPFAIVAYVVVTLLYIFLCKLLVPAFPIWFFFFFGFVFTPINSYINARMIGLTGEFAGIPFVREGAFLFSGYQGVDIWFAPIPISNFGGYVQRFREMELVRLKFTSLMKAEAFMVPIILVCSMCFWALIWKLGPIPSPSYPYAQKMWHLQALNSCLWISGTSGQNSWACLADGGVAGYERGKWETSQDIAARFHGIQVHQVQRPSRTESWFATEAGVFHATGETWVQYRQAQGLPNDQVYALAIGQDQRLYAATAGGLAQFDGQTWRRLGTEPVRSVLADRDGSVWCLTPSGLLRWNGQSWKHFDQTNGFKTNNILSMAIDRTGLFWAGTDQGLASFDGRRWTWSTPPDTGSASAPVSLVAIDEREGKWCLSGKQLYHYDETWTPESWPAQIQSTTIHQLFCTEEALWVCGDAGLFRRDRSGKWEDLSQCPGAPPSPIVSVDAREDQRWLLQAIKPTVIAAGLGVGLFGILGLGWLGLPVIVVYGFIRSLGTIPHLIMPEIIGALLGRYYFRKKFGAENWDLWTPVLCAGFACGMGLIGMASIAFVLAAKAVIATPF